MLSLVLAAAVATATPPAPPAAGPAKPADPLVCHSEPIDGSRITRKVCLKASEAARQRQEARQMLGQMQGSAPIPMTAMGPMH